MCGLPGSGKSFQSQKLLNENPNSCIINLDKMREMLVSKYEDFPFDNSLYSVSLNNIILNIKNEVLSSALNRKMNVIIDETHISKRLRKWEIERIKESSIIKPKIVLVYLEENNKEKLLEYRMQTPNGVSKEKWKSVIENMDNHFEIPDVSEGFDEIIKIQRG
jgi:predicted kinase